jgi:CHAD domain-containing protein
MSKLSQPSYLITDSLAQIERERAFLIADQLKEAIKRTSKKTGASQVHQLRVILRRWYSIWEILKEHSWQSKNYKEKCGKNLKKLNKALGQLRDLDVNIELARKYKVGSTYLKQLKEERANTVHQVEQLLQQDAGIDLGRRLKNYLVKRAAKLEARAGTEVGTKTGTKTGTETQTETCPKTIDLSLETSPTKSGYDQIDTLLHNLEKEVQGYATKASTLEDFHKLRLSIKQWRYLLSEFLGVSLLTLVKAQGLLGKHQDLNRLQMHLAQAVKTSAPVKEEEPNTLGPAPPPYKEKQSINLSLIALEEIERDLKDLESQIPELIAQLPYGMRPYLRSIKLPDSALAK